MKPSIDCTCGAPNCVDPRHRPRPAEPGVAVESPVEEETAAIRERYGLGSPAILDSSWFPHPEPHRTCLWYDDSDEECLGPVCGKPATHSSCVLPFGHKGADSPLNACEEHKCRCVRPVLPERGDGRRRDFPPGSRLEGNMAKRAELMIAGHDPGPHPDCHCQRPGWVESDGHSPWECEMHRPAHVDPRLLAAETREAALVTRVAELERVAQRLSYWMRYEAGDGLAGLSPIVDAARAALAGNDGG